MRQFRRGTNNQSQSESALHNNVFNPAFGGTWNLVAKTNAPHGIAGLDVILTNVNAGGITYQSGINATTIGGNSLVISGPSFVQVLYGQDSSTPENVVLNVGRGAGTAGNIPLDFINDPTWNNAARIMTGTFAAATPAFTMNNDTPPDGTDGNVWSTPTAPYHFATAATITTTVRNNFNSILGDYNRNGVVDIADYPLWRDTLNRAGQGLAADGSGSSVIDQADYGIWRNRFGANSGSGSASGELTTVPEPGAMTMIVALLTLGAMLSRQSRCRSRVAATLLLTLTCVSTHAANVTWIGGNVDWVDNSGITNWDSDGLPNDDEPDTDDTAIFNTANTVNMGSNNSILALTMSAGIDLNTNDFDLSVNGLVQIAGVGSNLFIGGSSGSVNADDVAINADGTIELRGGLLTLDEEVGASLLDINVGGNLIGNGTLSFADEPGFLTTILINDGELTALSRGLTIFSPPPVGTLQINTLGPVFSRVDLDGGTEIGVVNVNRNQTLDLNVGWADSFNGTLNLFQQSTFDSLNAWTLAGGSIVANNGFIDNAIPTPDVPAGTSFIRGGLLTQTGGTINVFDTDGTLQFDAAFTMNGGSFVNNGHVIFDGNATIGAAANFTMPTTSSSITVESGRTVTLNQTNFDLDGANSLTNEITVEVDGFLEINVSDYDPDSATNRYDGTITLNDGAIDVTTGDAEFVMDGVLNMVSNGVSLSFAEWSGEPLDIGNDSGVLDAKVNVSGTHFSRITAPVDFNSDADIHLDGVALSLDSTVNFDTANGVNNAEFTGDGFLRFAGVVNVNEAVTINMVGGVVDLDGSDMAGDFVNIDAPMTINAATMENFGRVNSGGGINTIDINNNVGLGVLTVNLDNPADEWTLNGPGVMHLFNDNTEATLLAGSDINIDGTMNVTGDVRTTARLDIAGAVTINTAGQPLRLSGGTTNDHNTIAGATISGVGILGADTARALHGFGTINTDIDFDGTANLRADDGTLTINGTIVDVNIIGTDDEDGVLNIPAAWNNNVSAAIAMLGGTVQGGTITNDTGNGIQGFGTVTARVINNTQLLGGNGGGTLLFQTAGNDNDWDGTTNTGELIANAGALLELRDNATFAFLGTAGAAPGGRVFTNGFALDFNPGSDLILSSGTYESTHSTNIGGVVTIEAGSNSTIKVEINRFLTFESTSTSTLASNLRLVNNNINIEAGATFSGAGALIVPDDSHMVADNLADIGVLLVMQGGFRPGNSEGIGRVDLLDYQQEDSGELFVEITGTALNAYDRLVVDDTAVIDGYLNVDIDGGFVPILNNTFNIVTANSRIGEFDYADFSGMPNGLTFQINYLSNAVQLQVVNTPFFSADFDDDGDVDKTDFSIWKGAFNLNQLGDADGDNDSDGADFLLWQRQFGSHPGMGAGSGFDTSVPEPSSLALISFALLAFGARTIRRLNARLYLVS